MFILLWNESWLRNWALFPICAGGGHKKVLLTVPVEGWVGAIMSVITGSSVFEENVEVAWSVETTGHGDGLRPGGGEQVSKVHKTGAMRRLPS